MTVPGAVFAAAVVVNLLLLYWPRPAGPDGVPHLDKAVHLVAFAAVAWSGLWAGLPAAWLLGLLAVHAGASEVVQDQLLPGRSGDVADVVADLAGILTGSALARASWRDESDVPPEHRR